MSSRYSKPCNLIQSFIYQQYSFHLSQLCVRMCRQISQLIAKGEGKGGSVIIKKYCWGEETLAVDFLTVSPRTLFHAGVQGILANTSVF